MHTPSKIRLIFVSVILIILSNSPVSSNTQDTVAARKYAVALGFQKKGLYEQAIQRWTQFIAQHPKHEKLAAAHHHLGTCQLRAGNFDAATATFQGILKQFPDFASRDSAQFNLGMVLYNRAQKNKDAESFKQAAPAFAQVITAFPESSLLHAARLYQAESLCQSAQLEAALPLYELLIKEEVPVELRSQAQLALGATLHDLGRLDEAAQKLLEFIQKPVGGLTESCRLRLGTVLSDQGKHAEAEQQFATAAQAAGFSRADLAWLKQAEARFLQDKVQEAAALYEQLPKKFAESQLIPLAWLSAGKCRFRSSQFPQASADLKQCLDSKAYESVEAAYWLGQTLVELKKFPEAIRTLDAAIQANPEHPDRPLCEYGRWEVQLKQHGPKPEFLQGLKTFVDQHPEHERMPFALSTAARTALVLDQIAESRALVDRFLQDPKLGQHPVVPNVLVTAGDSWLNGEGADAVKAEQFFRRGVAEFPQHALLGDHQLGIARALFAQGKYPDVVSHLAATAGALTTPEQKAESQLWSGRARLETQEYPQAIAAFDAARKAAPKWARQDEVQFLLAVGHRAAGQLEPATKLLTDYLNQFKQSSLRDQAMLVLGEVQLARSQYDAAEQHLNQLLKEYPQSGHIPDARYSLAVIDFEKKRYPESVRAIDQLLKLSPQAELVTRAQYLRGLSHLHLQNYQPGISDLQAYLATNPADQNAWNAKFALARCQAGLGQLPEAIKGFQELTAAENPRLSDVLYELGFAYLASEDWQRSIETFKRLATRFPDDKRVAEAWFHAGNSAYRLQKWDEAKQAFTEGLATGKAVPVREQIYYRLASLQFEQKAIAEARQTLQTLEKEIGEGGALVVPATMLAAECEFQLGQHPEAEKRFDLIVSRGDAAAAFLPQAMYRSAGCAAKRKDWPKSQKTYSDLIARFPEFEQVNEARYGLGVAHQNQQRLADARRVFQQVTELAPDTETAAKSWFMMGQCWFAEKQFAQAIDCFLEVAFGYQHPEWQPLSYFEAGRCYLQLKMPDRARKMLTAVVEEFPEHASVTDAKQVLESIP